MPSLENEVDDILEGFVPPSVSEVIPIGNPPEPAPASQVEPPVEGIPPNPPQEGSVNVEDIVAVPIVPIETPAPVAPVVDPRDAQIQQLQDTIAAMQQTIESVSRQVNAPAAPAPATEPVKTTFLEKEEDLDKALNSVDNFNALLANVLAKAEEAILAKVDGLAFARAHQVYTQRTSADEFYRINADLVTNKAYVRVVADEIAQANPTWDMAKIMEALAPEVRNRLKLSGMPVAENAPVAPQTPPPETPAFVPGSHARGGAGGGSMSKIEKEIADLISD